MIEEILKFILVIIALFALILQWRKFNAGVKREKEKEKDLMRPLLIRHQGFIVYIIIKMYYILKKGILKFYFGTLKLFPSTQFWRHVVLGVVKWANTHDEVNATLTYAKTPEGVQNSNKAWARQGKKWGR